MPSSSRVAGRRQMCQGHEGLLEVRHGLSVDRAGQRLRAGLTEIGERLVPHLAPHGMVGQPLDVLAQPLGVERLDASTIRAWSARRRSWSTLP